VDHVHVGLTSSDITDTALGLKLRESSSVLVDAFGDLMITLDRMAEDYADVIRLGRTHGQAAAPSTYGHLFAYWARGAERVSDRLWGARVATAICKISGPVGTYLHVDPAVERDAAAGLGLSPSPVSTQIYMRDGLAYWAGVVGMAASYVEAVAVELRLLAHEAIHEAVETGGSTSSAMPHKLNPNRLERLTGLARVVRSGYEPIAAGVAQWHDRDMSHSSVEKTYLPLMSKTLHYMAVSLNEILASLEIDQTRATLNYELNLEQVQTHSIQTALQLAGWPYREAAQRTREVWEDGDAAAPIGRLTELNADQFYAAPHPHTPNQKEMMR